MAVKSPIWALSFHAARALRRKIVKNISKRIPRVSIRNERFDHRVSKKFCVVNGKRSSPPSHPISGPRLHYAATPRRMAQKEQDCLLVRFMFVHVQQIGASRSRNARK